MKLDPSRLKFPTLPATTAVLIEMCNDPDVSFEQVARVIESDPGLAVKLLRTANSPFYGQQREITSVQRALTLLGLMEVRNFGLSYQIGAALGDEIDPEFDFETYWQDSVLMALVSRRLARRAGLGLGEEAFFMGLLQDVGIVVLRVNDLTGSRAVEAALREDPAADRCELERQEVGMDHAGVGALACLKWNFSERVIQSIRAHHRQPGPLDRSDPRTEAPALAYTVAQMPRYIRGRSEGVGDITAAGLLAPGDVDQLLAEVRGELELLATFFDRGAGTAGSLVEHLRTLAGQTTVTPQ